MNASKLVETVCFLHQKFDPMMNLQFGDFAYLDPPYIKVTNNSFVNYLSSGFSIDDFLFLLTFCERLTEKGCFFTLSNSIEIAKFVESYKAIKYCSKSIKGNLEQLLITNFRG
jgi:site-specific DNA-adenine methylase